MHLLKIEGFLLKVIKIGIFVTLLTPLILGPFGINFVEYPKAIFFRSLIEIIFFFYLSLIIFNKNYLPKKSIIFASLLLFYVVMFFASIFGINFFRSFFGDMPRGEGFILHLHLLAFFIITTGVFKDKNDWFSVFKTSILISGISSIAALLQQMQIAKFFTMYGDGTRVSGTLSNPDLFACYMSLAIFITFFILALEKNSKLKILWLFLIVLNTYTLFFSGTRGSWLGFICGILTLIFFNFSSLDHKKRNIIYLGILSIIGFIIFVNLNTHWIGNIPGGEVIERISQTGLSGRTEIWGPSLIAIKERPILGWGFESFAFVSDKYMTNFGGGVYFDRAHNKVVEILVYGGIVGLIAYLLIFISILYLIFRYSKVLDGYNNKNKIIYSSILVGFFVTYFVQNIFAFDNIGTYILFFLVVGFINNNFLESNIEKDSYVFKIKMPVKIAIISGIFLLTFFVFYEVNLKPTIAAMCFSSNIMYENADIQRALDGYKKGVSMNTVYDNDLRITFVNRSLYILNSGATDNVKKNIYNDLLEIKPLIYKAINDNDKQVNHLYQFLARISEQGYILYKNPNDLNDMEQILQKAMLFNSNVANFHQLMGGLRIFQNNYEEGEKYIKEGCVLDRCNDVTLYKKMGSTYLRKGDINFALKNFEKVIEINYEEKKKDQESASVSLANAKFIDYVAQVYCTLKDFQNCKRIYNKGSETYPEYSNFFYQRFEKIGPK
jgi:O-antigen ligase